MEIDEAGRISKDVEIRRTAQLNEAEELHAARRRMIQRMKGAYGRCDDVV